MPDIHGRTFWKYAIKRHAEEIYSGNMKIVFLGDYLDPYQFEYRQVGEIRDVIENFKMIVNVHIEEPEKCILLLGNHDLPYYSDFYKEHTGLFRYCYGYEKEIEVIMRQDSIDWKLAYKVQDITVDGKEVILSHAGILKSWVTRRWRQFETAVPDEKFLNSLLETDDGLLSLTDRSYMRSGRYPTGSMVWSDANEFLEETEYGSDSTYADQVYQIFGHTLTFPPNKEYNQLKAIDSWYISEKFAMIDSRRAFVLDENGKLFKDRDV